MGKRSAHVAEAPFVSFCSEAKGPRDAVARCAGPGDLFRSVKDDFAHVILRCCKLLACHVLRISRRCCRRSGIHRAVFADSRLSSIYIYRSPELALSTYTRMQSPFELLPERLLHAQCVRRQSLELAMSRRNDSAVTRCVGSWIAWVLWLGATLERCIGALGYCEGKRERKGMACSVEVTCG